MLYNLIKCEVSARCAPPELNRLSGRDFNLDSPLTQLSEPRTILTFRSKISPESQLPKATNYDFRSWKWGKGTEQDNQTTRTAKLVAKRQMNSALRYYGNLSHANLRHFDFNFEQTLDAYGILRRRVFRKTTKD